MIIRHITHRLMICFLFLAISTLALGSNDERSIEIERRKIEGEQIYMIGNDKRALQIAGADLKCRPFGECQACPDDELDQPFCQPFGNRRLLHCSKGGDRSKGELPAWESCGRVISDERRVYWEFITVNLLLLIVCLTVLWARTSALASQQYRQLAARIGIPSGGWTR